MNAVNSLIAASMFVTIRVVAIGICLSAATLSAAGAYFGYGQGDFGIAVAVVYIFISLAIVFFSYRGGVYLQRRNYALAIGCAVAITYGVYNTVQQNEAGLKIALAVVEDLRAREEGRSTDRSAAVADADAAIASARETLDQAKAAVAILIEQSRVTTGAVEEESATGFGARSEAASATMQESNASLEKATAARETAQQAYDKAIEDKRALLIAASASGDEGASSEPTALELASIAAASISTPEHRAALAETTAIAIEAFNAVIFLLLGLNLSDQAERRSGDGLSDEDRAAIEAAPPAMRQGLADALRMQRAVKALSQMGGAPATPAPPPPAPVPPEGEPQRLLTRAELDGLSEDERRASVDGFRSQPPDAKRRAIMQTLRDRLARSGAFDDQRAKENERDGAARAGLRDQGNGEFSPRLVRNGRGGDA